MDRAELVVRTPDVAAVVLFAVGGAAILVGVLVPFVGLPSSLGGPVSPGSRAVLAGFGVVGGALHLVGGTWARHRRPVFRIIAVTLVGMVVLQFSAPLDLLVLGLLVLGRDEFEDGDW